MLNILIYSTVTLVQLPKPCLILGILKNCIYKMESENIINFVFPKQSMLKLHAQINMHINTYGRRTVGNAELASAVFLN